MNPIRIVFAGDSITEEGRFDDKEGIGFGYVRLIRDYLYTEFPEQNFDVINRGVGGDRITHLKDRWEKDVLEMQPNFVSVSIGINDVWRIIDHSGEPGLLSADEFESVYERLITDVKNRTNAKLILMEPTLLGEDSRSEGNQMLMSYVNKVRELARKHQAILIPTHVVFINHIQKEKSYKLTTDGVHMTSIGDMLMAKTWLKQFLSAPNFLV